MVKREKLKFITPPIDPELANSAPCRFCGIIEPIKKLVSLGSRGYAHALCKAREKTAQDAVDSAVKLFNRKELGRRLGEDEDEFQEIVPQADPSAPNPFKVKERK